MEETQKLREAAELVRKGKMQDAFAKLGSLSEKLISFAEKISASVAAKAIEHALGL